MEGTWNGNSVVAMDAVAVTEQVTGDGNYSATLTIRLTPYANACGHELALLSGAGSFVELSVTVRSDSTMPPVPMQVGKVDVWSGIGQNEMDVPYAGATRGYFGSGEGFSCHAGVVGESQCGNDSCEWGQENPASCPADCTVGGSVTITDVSNAGGKDVVTGSFTYTESNGVSVTGTFTAPICNFDADREGMKHCCLPAPAG